MLTQQIKALDERVGRLEMRAEQSANILAETVFAVVRLEIATITDSIINSLLEVKRSKTGTGRAELALNVAGTLAMIAGNVMTSGGMTVLGTLIVSAGSLVKAAAANDAAGVFVGAVGVAAGGYAQGARGNADWTSHQSRGHSFGGEQVSSQYAGTTAPDAHGNLAQTSSEQAVILSRAARSVIPKNNKPPSTNFTVKLKSTAFINHGSGGTSAITWDVQRAIVTSYQQMVEELAGALSACADGGSPTAGGLLANFVNHSAGKTPEDTRENQTIKGIHPATSYVIKLALQQGLTQYAQTSAPSDTKQLVNRARLALSAEWNNNNRILAGDDLLVALEVNRSRFRR